MKYVFIYVFLLANGQEFTAQREAHTDNWRPVKTLEQCKKLAAEQQIRILESIKRGNDILIDVSVNCRRKK